jgi:hypothetical protein
LARPDQRASLAALASLARWSGLLRRVPAPGGLVSIGVDPIVRRRPRSAGKLHWAADTGVYREVWVRSGGSTPKLFHLYFGRWGSSAARAAYVVVFRTGNPQLEVRLSQSRDQGDRAIRIRHRLAFFGRRYRMPTALRDAALRRAQRAGLDVIDREVRIGVYDASTGALTPAPGVVLRRILLCALIKRSLVEDALAGKQVRQSRALRPRTFKRKRERFAKGRRAVIDMILDKRFEAHGRHNRLLNLLHERLEGLGYRTGDESPYDLVVRRGRAVTIIEAKGWPEAHLVGAVRAAAGQLLYYRYRFLNRHRTHASLVMALAYEPPPGLVDFAEKIAQIGLIWLTPQGQFRGGGLGRRILPGLVR